MSTRVAMRALAAVLLALGVFPLANLLTSGRAVPWFGGAAREWGVNGLVVLAIAGLIARVVPDFVDERLARGREWLLRPSPRKFEFAASTIAFVAALIVSRLAFAGQPFTSDEMAQQFHARVIASGHLAAQAESLREFFNTAPVFDRGAWFSQYPIGGPGLIALGVLVGAPWLVNPILLGVTTAWLHRALGRVADEFTARVATILFVASPMVLVMAGSQMNHVATLACTVLALWAALEWDVAAAPAQLKWAAIAGVALGLTALVRPLDAALVAACLGGFQALRVRSEPSRWRSLAVQCIAGAVPVAVLLWANANTTGSPLLFGYEALNGAAHGLGFHVDPNGDEHTPLRALILTSGYLMRLSLYLFEWPLPGVLVIAAGVAALRQPTRRDALLAALLAAFLAGYSAYWFDGFFAGPRFLFTALPVFVYFAARAPHLAADAPPPVRTAARLVLPLCVLMAWFGPWGVSSAPSRIELYRDQRTKLKTDFESQTSTARPTHALVFVREGWRGTLLARLRVLGATQFRAERVLNTVDACALQTRLDEEDASTDADSVRLQRAVARARAAGVARPVPNLPADQAIAIVPGSSPTPVCLAEFRRDSIGTMPYAAFLAKQTFERDGRVGGNIVFVRDMGARNERLRARFGDRTWYRYRPTRTLGDTGQVLLPYTP